MNSHTVTSQLIRARHAKRRRSTWLNRNALGLTVSCGVVLGLIVSVVMVVML